MMTFVPTEIINSYLSYIAKYQHEYTNKNYEKRYVITIMPTLPLTNRCTN